MKSTTVTKTKVQEVSVGDIFQFVKDSGCYKRGNLLVVKVGSNTKLRGVEFIPKPTSCAAYASLSYLSDEISAGTLRYAGTVSYPDILILAQAEA